MASTLDPARSVLLVVDVQARLMPAIEGGEAVVRNAGRLVEAAAILSVPTLFTEQNPRGLGLTVEALTPPPDAVMTKMSFDATREPALLARLPADADVVVCGCESHVCVLQTVLGLIEAGRRVFVVADAVGSRAEGSKTAALARMARHGAEIVTTEMVAFEWLGSAAHPDFKRVVALIK